MDISAVVAVTAIGFIAIGTLVISHVSARRSEARLRGQLLEVEAAEVEVRRLLDELPEAVMLIDMSGHVLSANAATTTLCRVDDAALLGTSFLELIDPGDRELIQQSWQRSVAGEAVEPQMVALAWSESPANGGVARSTGQSLVEASIHVPSGGAGATTGAAPDNTAPSGVPAGNVEQRVVVRLRDVSEREQQARALAQARARFQQAFQSAPTGMALVRLDDGRIVDANQSLAEMLDRDLDDFVGRTLREFTHVDDVRAAQTHRARLELGIVDSYRVDQRYRRKGGDYVWARTRVSLTEDDGVMLAINHIEDVTEQRRTSEQLEFAANHDDLTGLPNRSYLMQILQQRLIGAPPSSVAVLFIDLDHFKVVNDSLGHGVGDDLLRSIAERLQMALRGRDVLARFGGDEFVVVLDGSGRSVEAEDVAQRLRQSVHEPVFVGDQELYVTASVGYSSNVDVGMSPDDLLRDADAAMYRAKSRGRDCVEAFVVGDHQSSVEALRTAGELRRGIERGEIVPYYQPIVDLESGHVVGYEVLARWLHPDRGLLTPNHFLPIAEETGLLIELGARILRDSLAQLASWRARGLEFAGCSLSVNVGTRQLVDSSFYDLVVEVLAETGVDASSVWLEITETALLADVKTASVALRDLRSLGIHLSVDDFGTGYSSLTYLKRFPVESIKVDRAFVSGLGIESEDSTIVEAVVRLGQALGLTVVAEGIETPLQLARLRDLGCDSGQGYLFGRPRPADLIEHERTGSISVTDR